MKRVILLLWICIVFSAGLITGNLPDSDQLIILVSLVRILLSHSDFQLMIYRLCFTEESGSSC